MPMMEIFTPEILMVQIIKNSIITYSGSTPGSACIIFGTNSVVTNMLYLNLTGVDLRGGASSRTIT